MSARSLAAAQQTAPAVSDASIIEAVVVSGDLSKLTPQQRVAYYTKTCESLGLNPFTKPFDYINLSGKLTLYAKRDCCDQLRKINGISIEVVEKKIVDGIATVTVRARTPEGRIDEDLGAVTVSGAKGDAMANGLKKAITQAKRRVTLSICGLGWLDETEVEQVPGATAPPAGYTPSAVAEPEILDPEPKQPTPRALAHNALLARFGGDEAAVSKAIGILESIDGEITESVCLDLGRWLLANPAPACPVCRGTKRYSTIEHEQLDIDDRKFTSRTPPGGYRKNYADCDFCQKTGEWPPATAAEGEIDLPPATCDKLLEAYDKCESVATWDALEVDRAKIWNVTSKAEKTKLKTASEKAKKRLEAAA